MRKLLFAAFATFATFAILGCSSGDKMPCATCEDGEVSSRTYCFYRERNSLYCEPMNSKECKNFNGELYKNSTCDNSFRKLVYCLSDDGYYDCSNTVKISVCVDRDGDYYDDAVTCNSHKQSSSSMRSSSSVASSSSVNFCNIDSYGVKKIGDLVWMTKNYNCNVPGSKCYEGKDPNCNKYGRLYDWATAMGIDPMYNDEYWGEGDYNHKGICPNGWHIPSRADWENLEDAVGGDATKLKSSNQSSWEPNDSYYGTNESGFNAMPGGYGVYYNNFYDLGLYGHWWSATEDGYDAYNLLMEYDTDYVTYESELKDNLYSVRCVKNN